VQTGSLAALRHLTRTTLHVTTVRPLARLQAWPGVSGVEVSDDGRTARLEVAADEVGAVIERIATHGVVALTSAPPTLEELFLRHYGGELAHLNGDHVPGVAR
jgi:ABC-2 type transport system ATP-binding protein